MSLWLYQSRNQNSDRETLAILCGNGGARPHRRRERGGERERLVREREGRDGEGQADRDRETERRHGVSRQGARSVFILLDKPTM